MQAPIDMTGIPTHACPVCNARIFKTLVQFDDYQISWYSLVGYCQGCGTKVTLPTELDRDRMLADQLELLDEAEARDV